MLAASLIGFLGWLIIVFVIKAGLRLEREWINETLSQKKNISDHDSKVVQNLNKFKKIKRRIQRMFGKEKADLIERLLTTQAKIGIALKTQTKLTRDKERQQSIEHTNELYTKVEMLQEKIGSYGMLYVRNTFRPEHMILYENLAIRLENMSGTPNIDSYSTLSDKLAKLKKD